MYKKGNKMRRIIRRKFYKADMQNSLPYGSIQTLQDLASQMNRLSKQIKDLAAEFETEWQDVQQTYNDGTLPEHESDMIFQLGRQSRFVNQDAKDLVSYTTAMLEQIDKAS